MTWQNKQASGEENAKKYSDILSTEPELYTLVGDLQEVYTKPEVPQWLTWNTTKARYTEEKMKLQNKAQLPIALRWQPMRGVSLSMGIALALLLTTVVGAAAFAVPSLLQALYPTNLVQHDAFTPVEKSATVNGTQITVNSAYADANQVIVGRILKGPDAQFLYPTLKTKLGQVIPLMVGSYAPSIDGRTASTQAWYFDAVGITGNPTKLDLVLQTYACHPGNPGNECQQKLHKADIAFTVPFRGGKVVNVQKSVTSKGKTVTLERIVIADSGTRIIVRGIALEAELRHMSQLSVPGEKPFDEEYSTPVANGDYSFIEKSLVGKHGTWTFTITEEPLSQNRGTDKVWHFTFSVS